MEIFKDSIKGYEVSNYGNVFTKERIVKANDLGGIRKVSRYKKKHSNNGIGYLFITASYKGVVKKYYIHRLVAEAFIPNPENKPTVNHIDGNKNNNHISNLEWATYQEQGLHKIKLGLNNSPKKAVLQYDLNYNFIASYDSVSQAALETGIIRSSIAEVVKPSRPKSPKTAGGFIWSYYKITPLQHNIKLTGCVGGRPKEVFQYDLNYNFITSYDSVSAAAKLTGIIRSSICEVASPSPNRKYPQKTAGGFIWRYTKI